MGQGLVLHSSLLSNHVCHVLQEALELAEEGRTNELAGTKLCRHALSLALLEMDSELTDVHTCIEMCQRELH